MKYTEQILKDLDATLALIRAKIDAVQASIDALKNIHSEPPATTNITDAELNRLRYEFRERRPYDKRLTIKEAAEVIGKSVPAVHTYIGKGLLKAERVGGKWRVRESDAKAFVPPVGGNPNWHRQDSFTMRNERTILEPAFFEQGEF